MFDLLSQVDRLTVETSRVSQPASNKIATLPNEILAKIFRHAVSSPVAYSLPRIRFCEPPLSLSQVCATWRFVACGTPEIWESLDMGKQGQMSSGRLLLVKDWLSRAHKHALRLRVGPSYPQIHEDVLAFLYQLSNERSHTVLEGKDRPIEITFEGLARLSLSRLAPDSTSVPSMVFTTTGLGYIPPLTIVSGTSSPHFELMSFHHSFNSLLLSNLNALIPWDTLTSLKMHFSISPSQLFNILRRSLNLLLLDTRVSETRAEKYDLAHVTHDNLQVLKITSYAYCPGSFLNFLGFPSLRTLHVHCASMLFEWPHMILKTAGTTLEDLSLWCHEEIDVLQSIFEDTLIRCAKLSSLTLWNCRLVTDHFLHRLTVDLEKNKRFLPHLAYIDFTQCRNFTKSAARAMINSRLLDEDLRDTVNKALELRLYEKREDTNLFNLMDIGPARWSEVVAYRPIG